MTGAKEDDLGPVDGLGPHGVQLAREDRLGRPEVEPGQRAERFAEERRVGRDEHRELVEDPLDLRLLGHLCLAPGVAQLHDDEGLDEQGLAAAGGVVDDALDPRAGVGLDRHHVAAVAERDDRLLERRSRAPSRRAYPAAGGGGRRPPEPRRAARRGGAMPCRGARRRGRSCGRACCAAPAGRGPRGQGRGAAGAARRRGRSPGVPPRPGSRRSRGTGLGRGGRTGPPARPRARCRGPSRCRSPAVP